MTKRGTLAMLAGAVALVSVAAVGAYVVASAVGFPDREGESSFAQGTDGEEAVASPTSDLSEPGSRPTVRDGLYFCVDAVDSFFPQNDASAAASSAIEQSAFATVELAFPEIAKHRYWDKIDLGVRSAPMVFGGCPSAPLPLTAPDANWIGGDLVGTTTPSVAVPSPYFGFVFVMPEGEIQNLLGSATRRVIAQEFRCESDYHKGCFSETYGIYITPEEAEAGTERVAELIEVSVGLRKESQR